MNRFPVESFETLGNYVYRLIDPRDGKAFYVGKGYGNRVLSKSGKVEFTGNIAEANVRNLFIHKILPKVYRKQGNASDALYKKKTKEARTWYGSIIQKHILFWRKT